MIHTTRADRGHVKSAKKLWVTERRWISSYLKKRTFNSTFYHYFFFVRCSFLDGWDEKFDTNKKCKFFPKSGPRTEAAPHIFWMGPSFISGPSIEPGSRYIPLALGRSCWAPHEPSSLMLSPAKARHGPGARRVACGLELDISNTYIRNIRST